MEHVNSSEFLLNPFTEFSPEPEETNLQTHAMFLGEQIVYPTPLFAYSALH
jgi:hypothetical protein